MNNFKKKLPFYLITISIITIFLIVYFILNNFFQTKSYDFMIKKTSFNNTPSSDIILVVIDDKSLVTLGRWPWNRTMFSEIFEYLENYTGAKILGFDAIVEDINFDNQENDKKFFNDIKKYKKLHAGVFFNDYDSLLSEKEQNENLELLNSKTVLNINDKSKKNFDTNKYKSFSEFPSEYFNNIHALGHINFEPQPDGYIRKANTVIKYKNHIYPTLALSMYSDYTGIRDFILTDKYLTGKNENFALKIPLEYNSGVIQNNMYFYKTQDEHYIHQKISASDVILSLRAIKQGKKPILDKKIFENKVVFIGANANAKALEDNVKTPISEFLSGIEVQAINFNNLIDNSFIRTINPIANLLIIGALLGLVFLFIYFLNFSSALLASVFVMVLYFLFVFIMYQHKIAIDFILSELSIITEIIIWYSYKFILERQKKQQLENVMSKYISKDVMKNVVQNIEEVKLGGKKAIITVLFADIRGFTTISENLGAEEVSSILNEYFSRIVPIIEKYNGTLNKFVGDAVLAIFGEPIQDKNHALNAVKCADEMHRTVKKLQKKWIEEGKPKIEIGIGIATGEAFVGNIGSDERFEYTVIGDTVNTASRLESYNKVYRTNCLINQSTYEAVQRFVDVIKIREVTIRGKAKKVNVYEVLRIMD